MANTTEDKLSLLAQNKSNIKTAIESMSPQIAPTDVMSNWPQAMIGEEKRNQIIVGIKNRMFGEGMMLEKITFDDWIRHISKI